MYQNCEIPRRLRAHGARVHQVETRRDEERAGQVRVAHGVELGVTNESDFCAEVVGGVDAAVRGVCPGVACGIDASRAGG